MATISEIPIDVTEAAQPDEQVETEGEEAPLMAPATVETEREEAPAPKKRGRPAGAKNRPKVVPLAPKPKKKPVAKKAPPVESESEEEEESEGESEGEEEEEGENGSDNDEGSDDENDSDNEEGSDDEYQLSDTDDEKEWLKSIQRMSLVRPFLSAIRYSWIHIVFAKCCLFLEIIW